MSTPKTDLTKSPITHTCEEMSRGSVWHRFACGKTAKFHELRFGKLQWCCGMHAPSERARRQKERDEARRKFMAPIVAESEKRRRLENAASDLLEVAKMVDAACEGRIGGVLFEADSPLVKAARAALAKAEGKP
jgi:hypothetical protein